MRMSRRQFLLSAGAVGLDLVAGRAQADGAPQAAGPPARMVDFHTHLLGVGDGGTGCVISAKQRTHWNYRYFMTMIGHRPGGVVDDEYLAFLVHQLRSSAVSRALLQAWDCRYDDRGRMDLAHTTSLYVPNDYLFRVVKRHPALFIPCASINPKRRDALDEVDRCAALGARAVKVHPPTMAVDPGDRRYRAFYRRCAKRHLVLMVHTGTEHAADIVGNDWADPARLRPALDEGGMVVAAHAGTRAFFDREDYFPHFRDLIGPYPNLYCDTAVLASMFRWRVLPEMLRDPRVVGRMIHGSDFPFASNALVFWNRLRPSDLVSIVAERNLFDRDWKLKRALGVPDTVLTRVGGLLKES